MGLRERLYTGKFDEYNYDINEKRFSSLSKMQCIIKRATTTTKTKVTNFKDILHT